MTSFRLISLQVTILEGKKGTNIYFFRLWYVVSIDNKTMFHSGKSALQEIQTKLHQWPFNTGWLLAHYEPSD